MELITMKEQAMTWLMSNKKKEERLEAMKAIAIKNMKSAPVSKQIMSRHNKHDCF